MTSFLQSPAWQVFQESAGIPTNRHNEQLYLCKKFPFGTYWQSSRFTATNFEIPNFTQKACFIRLEPEDENTLAVIRQNHQLVRSLALQPRQTLILDIAQPYEDILSSFKQKTRYNLKVSHRSELEVDIYSRNLDNEHFDRFWALMSETSHRHGFRTHPAEYYQLMLSTLSKENMAHLIFVRRHTQDLACMILITYEDTATYLHGASSSLHHETKAAYFLHDAAIRHAQVMGAKTYDFWGTDAHQVDGEWKAKDGVGSAGTTQFKLGFGGKIVEYPGCFDLVLKPFWYNAYKKARSLRGGKRDFA